MSSGRPIKVVRIIARLNIGGPAQQVVLLTHFLDPAEFNSTLICGVVPETEGDMSYYAAEHGVEPLVLESMSSEISLLKDLRTVRELLGILRRIRPDVVHTHTAKAGFVGRIAARLVGVPVIIHTYHGHVLSGYFGKVKEAIFRSMERFCGRFTTVALAVSEQVREDLLRMRILPPEKLRVMPLGLDLQRFADGPKGRLRAELGLGPETPLIGFCGRLVPIKNVPLLLQAMDRVQAVRPDARLVMIGAGEQQVELMALAKELHLAEVVNWLGWRQDTDQLFGDLDLMVISSRNEGTPVALIEAGAAGVPAISTNVGGVSRVVVDGETGWLTPPDDTAALAAALTTGLSQPEERARRGRQAQLRCLKEFGFRRQVNDIASLYREFVHSR